MLDSAMRALRCIAAASIVWGVVAASPADEQDLQERADFAVFLGWLRQHGAEILVDLDLAIDPTTGIRSLIIREPVAAGTQLIVVPNSAILTVDGARQAGETWQTCSASNAGQEPAFMAPEHTTLALYFLEQRAPGSRWFPWLTLLPKSFDSAPAFFRDEDFQEFQASHTQSFYQRDRRLVQQDYDLAAAHSPSGISLEEFRWARQCVLSRQFNVHHHENGTFLREEVLMVPLLDFVNHPMSGKSVSNVVPHYNREAGVTIEATEAIEAGQGLYCHYGTESNRLALHRWGFTDASMLGPEGNNLPIFLRLATELPAPDARAAVVARSRDAGLLALEPDGTVLHEVGRLDGPAAEKLLGHLRFLALTPRQLKSRAGVLDRTPCNTTFCSPLSAGNEQKALRKLIAMLKELESEYTTSEESDVRLLQGDQQFESQAHRDAVVVRLGEKRLASKLLQVLQIIEPLFELSVAELAEQIRQNLDDENPHWSGIDVYVKKIMLPLVEVKRMRPRH